MLMRLLDIGHGSFIRADRVVSISDAQLTNRVIDGARLEKRLIDCTQGHRKQSAVLTDSGQVFLSALGPEELFHRRGAESAEKGAVRNA